MLVRYIERIDYIVTTEKILDYKYLIIQRKYFP